MGAATPVLPQVISEYFNGTRRAMEVTLRLIYIENQYYFNNIGAVHWKDLAA